MWLMLPMPVFTRSTGPPTDEKATAVDRILARAAARNAPLPSANETMFFLLAYLKMMHRPLAQKVTRSACLPFGSAITERYAPLRVYGFPDASRS